MNALQMSDKGLDLIKMFEGFSPAPYMDIAGRWTIGYGHTRGVNQDTPHVTKEQATELLREEVQLFENEVNRSIRVLLNQNQFDALVSLTYNTGSEPLFKTLGADLNRGNYQAAADQFSVWVYAGGKISDGLIKRRAAERELFLTPVE